jgi:hypothetical protein
MDNQFLRAFINMRKGLAHTESQKKTIKKADHIRDGNITLQTIIDDKPPNKDVIEYLRRRVEEIQTIDE